MTGMPTPTDTSVSSVPRRTLGIALRRARENAKITLKRAAEELGQSELSARRIEQGVVSTPFWKVEKLCNLYNVGSPMRETLLELSKQTRERGSWQSYGDAMPNWFELYMALEATARRIRVFEPVLVPGLLQAPGYIAAVIRADAPDLDDQSMATRVEVRQARQQLLTRAFPAPPQVEVIISEAVLMAEPTEEDMRQQVWNLIKANELPTTSVRVLPVAAGPYRGGVAGGFTLLDFHGENGNEPPPSTVYVENLTGAAYLDKPKEIAAYEHVWDALDRGALSQQDSIGVMGHRLKELTDRVAQR